MIPKLPIDFNSDSAFEKLKFIEEHYEELMLAYKDIMEHLKIPVGFSDGGNTESPFEEITITNPKPMYVTLRFVDNLPVSYKVACYFGSPKFDSSDYIDNDTVGSYYIQNLVGASYYDEIVPSDQYYYFLRIYRDGVEIDYESSSLNYSYNEEDWEGLELRLYRVNRFDHSNGEDLGEFVTAVENLFIPAESELKPTDDEVFRNLQIQNENYLINKTDTPYTYAIDCCKYSGMYINLNGGTFSNIGTVESGGGYLGISSGCSHTSEATNHFYVNVLVYRNDYTPYSSFQIETYKAEEDNTPFTFTRLVPKV